MTALRSSLESKEKVRLIRTSPPAGDLCLNLLFAVFKEGSQVSSSLAALQAEREVLLRSARERDAELASLKQQAQQQQGYQDLERDRLNRELEALRAQLQQQVSALVVHGHSFSVFHSCCWLKGATCLFSRPSHS